MYVVTVEFVVIAGRGQDFLQAMVANARTSREVEPGCRQFDVCVDPDDPLRVFLYERYADRAAFDAHLASADRGPAVYARISDLTRVWR